MITRLDHHQDQRSWDILSAATGTVAWDVGCNIGQSTKVLAEHFDHVLAFEPCRESFDILAAEMPANVECLNIAVSSINGSVRLSEAHHSISTGQLTSGPGLSWGEVLRWRSVPCRTLDSFLVHNTSPDFVKIDTEGHEVEIVKGAAATFAQLHRCIIEVHRRQHEAQIRDLLPDWRWEIHRHGDYVRVGGPTWLDHFWLVGER